MDCEHYFALMSGALDGELAPWERRKLAKHLAQCPHCTARFQALSVQSEALHHLDCPVPEELLPQIMNRLPQQEQPQTKLTPHVNQRLLRWAALAACMGLTILFSPFFPQLFADGLAPSRSSLLQTEALISQSENGTADNASFRSTADSLQGITPYERQSISSPAPAVPGADFSLAAAVEEDGIAGLSKKSEPQYYDFQNAQYLWVSYGATPAPNAEILGSRNSLLTFLSQFPQDESNLAAAIGSYGEAFFQTYRLLAVVTESADGAVLHTLAPQGLLRSQVTLLATDAETAAEGRTACLILAEVGPTFEDGDLLEVIIQ